MRALPAFCLTLLLGACGTTGPKPTPHPTWTCRGIGDAPVSSTALEPTTATYLGLEAGDEANAVDLTTDCAVVVGGRMSGNNFGQAPTVFLNGTSGAVLRLDSKGQEVVSLIRIGGVVNDLEVRREGGQIAVAGDFGLALLGADGNNLLWSVAGSGSASRVAVSHDGTVAALFGKTLKVYDAQGRELGSRSFGDSAVNDVALDGSSQTVFVTGFAQRDGGPCTQLQVAWVRAYDYSTQILKWRAYDWTHAQAAAANNSCADTRGMRVAMGRDGKLYFAGESAGGNSLYRYDSADLAQSAPNVKYDKFTDAFNTASNHITYFARFDPATGRQITGQILLSRLPDNKGNTLRPRAITADEAGRVYVAGLAACCIANRQGGGLKLNGQALPDYSGGDGWVLVTTPDFKSRSLWMVWNKGGKGEVRGLAAGGGIAALSAGVGQAPFHAWQAVQSNPSGGYLSVWPGWKQ